MNRKTPKIGGTFKFISYKRTFKQKFETKKIYPIGTIDMTNRAHMRNNAKVE